MARSAYIKLLSLFALTLTVFELGAFAQTELNQKIENIAHVEYTQYGRSYRLVSDPATFVVAARPSQSNIRFYRYGEAQAENKRIQLAPTEYSLDGTRAGTFVPIGPAEPWPGMTLDLSNPVSIVPVENFLAEDMIIIEVEDLGHNISATTAETLLIEIGTKDQPNLVLKLVEDGTDSGHFYGYIPTYLAQDGGDQVGLRIASGAQVYATYTDSFSAADQSSAATYISSSGRVFDVITGEPVNTARVSIFNAESGAPAAVYGRDTVSYYPAEVTTGQSVRDSAGNEYTMQPGEFIFPFLKKGSYSLLVETPEQYIFPSLIQTASRTSANTKAQKGTEDGRGIRIDLAENGALSVSIPVDPVSDILVEKTTDVTAAAIGEFVPYSVTVTNRGESDAYVRLRDLAPRGFRMEAAALETEAGRQPLPVSRLDARTSEFDLGLLAQGDQFSVTYTMQIVAGAARGRQTNRIYVLDGRDQIASNIAQAEVMVREDLLRSKGTITGSVNVSTCSREAAFAPHTEKRGLGGVQIYLETGAYVTSDARGKFHFEDVDPGTHVVQVDSLSLPDGYELVLCENSTRAAGSSRSRFVEMTGGAITQVEFAVRKIPEAEFKSGAQYLNPRAESPEPPSRLPQSETQPSTSASIAKPQGVNLRKRATRFDLGWLNAQDNSARWVYPNDEDVLAIPAVDLGLKYATNLSLDLFVNGQAVSRVNNRDRQFSTDMQRVLSHWKSVDLEEGSNRIEAVFRNEEGQIVERLTRKIFFTTRISRAAYLPEQSRLVADGKTAPEIAIKLMDPAGQPVHKGRILAVNVAPPYRLYQENRLEDSLGLTTSLAANGSVSIGEGGIARIKLDPTFQSGLVDLTVQLEDDRFEQIPAYLIASKRPWLVVGLIEGQAGIGADPGTRHDLDPLSQDDDPYRDGRVAVYATGAVGEDVSVTLGIDTDKRRSDFDDGFNLELDPTATYTQFGDRSYQELAAPSSYPVYAKIEKGRSQALFGDFQTGLNQTELSRYGRQLSGIQLTHQTDQFSFTAFASETLQQYQRLELAADGTSGPYQLNRLPILLQSERITIETRERFRPDQVLSRQIYTRYIHYDVDYTTGELIFRAPVPTTDAAFNPNVIVIEYETTGSGERDITAGGRAELALMDQRLLLGFSVIREAGLGEGSVDETILGGFDSEFRFNDSTLLRAEYASTEFGQAREALAGQQDALFLELDHKSDLGSFLAYFREQDTGFGLGQQAEATEDIRRYGAAFSRELTPIDSLETGQRKTRNIRLEAYEEANLSTNDSRQVARAEFSQSAQSLSWDTGLTYAREDLTGQETRESVLLNSGVRKYFEAQGLTLLARHEQALSARNDVASFPQKTVLGADKILTEFATLNVRHEIIEGTNVESQISRAGITLTPWEGVNIRSELDQTVSESDRRLAANIGLDQTFILDQHWSTGFGFSQRFDIDGDADAATVLPTSPQSPLSSVSAVANSVSQTFRSGYAGLGYNSPSLATSGRFEFRDTEMGTRYTLAAASARQMNDAVSYAGTFRFERSNLVEAADRERLEARLGFAYRPEAEDLILFNRLDFERDTERDVQETWKLVNNFSANLKLGQNTEWAGFLGTKYAESTLYGEQFKGWTHLVGTDLRRDLTDKWDIGISGSALYSPDTNTTDYAFGASLGYSPVKNVWLSAGYNFDGLIDDDFAASEYAREGPYIKLRMKFDEETIEDALQQVLQKMR